MKTHAYANRFKNFLLAILLLMLMSIPTGVLAVNNASEEEAILPIRVSHTDMVVDVRIQTVEQIKDGNSETKNMKDEKLGKLEIHRNSVEGTEINVTYKITVTNNGNAPGTAEKVFVLLPKAADSVSTDWKTESSTVLTSTEYGIIEAGQSVSKEITIKGSASEMIGSNTTSAMVISNEDIDQRVIQKNQGVSVTGTKDESTIRNTNNYDQTSLIISISTGFENIKIVILILLNLIVFAISIYLIKKYIREKQLKN